jgi:hypothetical protein
LVPCLGAVIALTVLTAAEVVATLCCSLRRTTIHNVSLLARLQPVRRYSEVCCFNGLFRRNVTQTQYRGTPAWSCPRFVISNCGVAAHPAKFEDNLRTLDMPESPRKFLNFECESAQTNTTWGWSRAISPTMAPNTIRHRRIIVPIMCAKGSAGYTSDTFGCPFLVLVETISPSTGL